MRMIGLVLWMAISSIIWAIVLTFAMSKLWLWFLSGQYGAGPSRQGWYGIAMIIGLINSYRDTLDIKENVQDKFDTIGEILIDKITLQLCRYIGCAAVLGFSWLVGTLLGWIR